MFKIGLENVQLKIKTVKSIRNRYLYFSSSYDWFEMHFIGIKFYKTSFKFFQGFGPCFLVR